MKMFLITISTDDPKSIWICSERPECGDGNNLAIRNSVFKADIQVKFSQL